LPEEEEAERDISHLNAALSARTEYVQGETKYVKELCTPSKPIEGELDSRNLTLLASDLVWTTLKDSSEASLLNGMDRILTKY
jgi:hypothetical protein